MTINRHRWVRVTRQQRDAIEEFVRWGDPCDEANVRVIVEQWDKAPDDDGYIRGMIIVGSIITVGFPVAIIAALAYWLLS